MGLLDDAIREHLELKRRRGADPTEIERAEREALGPVRRTPEAMDPLPYAPDEEPIGYAEERATAYADEDEPGWDEEQDAEDSEPPEEEAPSPRPQPAYPRDAELAAEAPPPRAAHRDPGLTEQETAEYRLEPGADEDVLEETPDFLQDAPEHDRLWFEQRPPRDFDFNE